MASFEKNKSGKWSVRFRLDEGDKIKNKRLSGYNTKKDAQAAYVEFMANYCPPQKEPSDEKNPTFVEILTEYMAFGKTRWKESSYYDAKNKIDNHILPFFKQYKMREITPAVILAWQRSVSDYSYKYKCTLRGYLSAICRYAYKYHDIPNAIEKTDGFRRTDLKKEMQVYTPDQFAEFCKCADDKRMILLFRTLYTSGCRKGEIAALTWNDIDTTNNTLRVNKSVSRKVDGKPWVITTPKNQTSVRTIKMPYKLLKELCELRGDAPGDWFVFGGDRPIGDNAITRALNKYADAAGLHRIRVHDFRHSCASYLISSGVSIVAVSKRLGHSNIEQTLNTYSHLMPQDEDKITAALDLI